MSSEQLKKYKFVPGSDYIMIRPLPERKYMQVQTVPDPEAKQNKGKNPEKHIIKTKQVEEEVKCEIQLAVVEAIPNIDGFSYNIGDIVAYNFRSGKDFDLVNGTKLIRAYEILGLAFEVND